MRESALVRQYSTVAEAMSLLLYPHAEVILHDLRTGLIAGLWNAFSGRRVGDESLLDEEIVHITGGQVWGPYEKTGPRGERLKSITAALSGDPGKPKPIGLLCVNLDVSRLEEASKLLAAFVTLQQDQPEVLFGRDWREQIQSALHGWLKEKRLSLVALGADERRALVNFLDGKGLFETRNAANHTATLLGISRSSFYNLLRNARAVHASESRSSGVKTK